MLLTGASGFLGTYIKETLSDFDIITLSRKNDDISIDLSNGTIKLPYFDLVVHAAGKAHFVPKTKSESLEFFKVNVIGTANLLKSLEAVSVPKSFVFISSVAVYGKENGNMLGLDTALMAKDPYGHSKIKAEELVLDWCIKNNVICTILRLPLIAGINPPGNLKSMINGIKKGYYFNIGGGKARKSIVLAEDVGKVIPKVAEIGGIYNLTDGYHPSLSELSCLITKQLNKNEPGNIPMWFAEVIAIVGDLLGSKAPINSNKLQKITSDLTFDDSKARKLLGWNPTPVLEGFKIA